MKSIKIVSLITCLIITFIIGCKDDLLESVPYGQSTSADFWKNESDVVSAVNAIYEPLREEDYYGHAEHTFSIPEDDQWRAGDHGEDQAIEELTFDPDNAQLRFSWRYKYEMISRANAVLINAPEVVMDDDIKNRSLGEAYFLRGFSYWRLHVIYGATPIILEEDVLAGEFNKAKPTIAEMQAQIESDLIQAADLLPQSYQADADNLGRVNKGSAYGLLCKLYMYMERFDDAIEAGNMVVNGPYELAENFSDNFTISTENNPEMLFSVQALDGWAGSTHNIYTTPRPWGGWDFQEPTQNLINEFEEDDPRLDASVFLPGEMVDLGGDAGLTEYTTDLSQTGYHFQKFASWRSSGGLDGGQNIPILRSADIYLLVAEAKIRLGGNGDTEFNAVRTRSDLSPKTNVTMEDIIHERRVELAGENQRHFDLMRWDKAGIVDIVEIYGEDRGQFDPPRFFDRNKHYYFAIPQREIDLSNGVLLQNDGY
ncbi:RagB/SusD family nutrient uptake outer membrane protein [Flexithrix dorotheae]|uniref:RagB/SusD family nutrient uptake outer membrane protein n=1 Tax=Flexithrix dorotheae TaxID=70993 RepID=UPI00047752B4|nr:RagB/SusD family nutrient uptake outer membrane protein [Flexithrix dorotheae]